MSEFSQKWISGDGGPLILMEERLLPLWDGSDAPANGRVVIAESRWGLEVATDYDRACDIREYTGVIKVGDGEALVLSTDGENQATWLTNTEMLVEWCYAESEADLLKEVELWAENGDILFTSNFEVTSSRVVLLVSAEAGTDPLYDRLTFDLMPGRYIIESGVRENESTSVVCHRFKLR